MANQEQLQILKQGVDVWNQWRCENPTTEIDLSMTNLGSVNLSGFNLREASLIHANLSGADLRGADLRGAYLESAILESANLREANLSFANLRKAVLVRADLRKAVLWKADLRKASLWKADLREASLDKASLTGSNLTGANLIGVALSTYQQRQIEEGEAERNARTEAERKLTEAEQKKGVIADNGSIAVGNIQVGGNVYGNINVNIIGDMNAPADEVSFTAYHPKEGGVETWHTLLVYSHMLSARESVYNDAKRFDDQIKSPKETTSKSTTPIVRGTELTVVPSCEGVTFNPEHVTLKWVEDFHRSDFRFRADKSLLGDAAKGSIDIYVGPLLIGTLKFAMLFNEKNTQPALEHEESANMYGKDDIFISYSRKDTDIARTFKTVLESSGFDVFLDVDDIISGQLWEEELQRRIKQAKIFQIFWSANYSQSENCKKEWEYAMQQNKNEGYIRPVFWEKPISPMPPEELNKFNFKYVELK